MENLKLYKLLATEDNEYETALAEEIRWVSDEELLVWIPYLWIKEFIDEFTEMFGYEIFDDGSFDGIFQNGSICINLKESIGEYIDLESIFPKDKYKD